MAWEVSRASLISTQRRCGFAGAGNTCSGRNLEVDKVRSADSLTRPVNVMVINVVKRNKRSRREEVDGCWLKWAVDKKKRRAVESLVHARDSTVVVAKAEGAATRSASWTRGRLSFCHQPDSAQLELMICKVTLSPLLVPKVEMPKDQPSVQLRHRGEAVRNQNLR